MVSTSAVIVDNSSIPGYIIVVGPVLPPAAKFARLFLQFGEKSMNNILSPALLSEYGSSPWGIPINLSE
jgi:hypothetical protein